MFHEDADHGQLTKTDFEKLRLFARERRFKAGELIFAEGEQAEYVCCIEDGEVTIFLQKFTSREEVAVLRAGDFFGEMAVLQGGTRSASAAARTDVTLLVADRQAFLALYKNDGRISGRINRAIASRYEQLVLKEKLVTTAGIPGQNLRISIKGDPSLRETAFTRERHESVVDKVLPRLIPKLQDLLLNRSVYSITIHFNSGEVRCACMFDPFNEEIHPANKIVDLAYIDRHFPIMAYDQKMAMLKRLYAAIADDVCFRNQPDRHKKAYLSLHESWKPLPPVEIVQATSQLVVLRSIPEFYLRNFTISVASASIRMQFNCDGTHIVGTDDYLRFINENMPRLEPQSAEPVPVA